MSKFTWDKWDFDCDGEAYIIKKSLCPNRDDVPDFIVQEDSLHDDCKQGIVDGGIQEGWCKYQVRTDWENCDGEPTGGYFVREKDCKAHRDMEGKNKRGWFEVWIVRVGEWY